MLEDQSNVTIRKQALLKSGFWSLKDTRFSINKDTLEPNKDRYKKHILVNQNSVKK